MNDHEGKWGQGQTAHGAQYQPLLATWVFEGLGTPFEDEANEDVIVHDMSEVLLNVVEELGLPDIPDQAKKIF